MQLHIRVDVGHKMSIIYGHFLHRTIIVSNLIISHNSFFDVCISVNMSWACAGVCWVGIDAG